LVWIENGSRRSRRWSNTVGGISRPQIWQRRPISPWLNRRCQERSIRTGGGGSWGLVTESRSGSIRIMRTAKSAPSRSLSGVSPSSYCHQRSLPGLPLPLAFSPPLHSPGHRTSSSHHQSGRRLNAALACNRNLWVSQLVDRLSGFLVSFLYAAPKPMPFTPRRTLALLATVFGLPASSTLCEFAWISFPTAAKHYKKREFSTVKSSGKEYNSLFAH
jgi:hypothetical protein